MKLYFRFLGIAAILYATCTAINRIIELAIEDVDAHPTKLNRRWTDVPAFVEIDSHHAD